MKRFRSIAPLAFFMLIVLAGLNACSKRIGNQTAPTVVRGVRVITVQNQQLPDQVSAVGSVHSGESAAIASQVMGIILRVSVHEGDHIRAGDTLIVIYAASLRSDVDRAHAAVVSVDGGAAAAESETRLAAATLKRYAVPRCLRAP